MKSIRLVILLSLIGVFFYNVRPANTQAPLLQVESVSIKKITASSTSSDYQVNNLVDGREDTCWADGKPDLGIGSWVKIELMSQVRLNRISFINGYNKVLKDKYGDRFTLNPRVKKLKLDFSDGRTMEIDLADTREIQHFALPNITTNFVKATILEVYPASRDKVQGGGKSTDTSISEVVLWSPDRYAGPFNLENESVAGIKLNSSRDDVIKALGAPDQEVKERGEEDLDCSYRVNMAYRQKGLTISLHSNTSFTNGRVHEITFSQQSTSKTSSGIGIGSSLQEFEAVYGKCYMEGDTCFISATPVSASAQIRNGKANSLSISTMHE